MEQDDYRNRFAFIGFLLILLAFGIGRIPLGIDLEGGAELTYTANILETQEDVPDIMARTATVISNRIDPAGTSSYQVSSSDERILITMGGASSTETQRVQKLLSKSGRLEMRLELRDGGYRSEDFNKALTARREGRDNPIEGTHWYRDKSGRELLIEDYVYITGEMLRRAVAETAGMGSMTWKVSLIFDGSKGGVEALRKISSIAFENNRSGMAIILNDIWTEEKVDGKTVRKLVKKGICDSAPSVQAEFGNGMCEISGGYTKDEADELVTLLDSGSLPVEIVPESSVIVGPTLGQASIERGQASCILGMVLIFVFMTVYYRQLGLVANLCLIINLFIIWVIMAKFRFVLTLPGIAGVLLTIGMAVDANVLIFERIKEELREGHPMARAVQTGYEKAFVAIFDANLTTFLTGVILYMFGSGPVRGFAVTLCIGIVASMFSAIYVSRAVVDWLLETGRLKEASKKRLFSGKVDFFGAFQKMMAVVSIVAVFSGLTYVIKRGDDNLGLDFRGGTRLHIAFVTEQDKLSVRDEAQEAINTHDWTDKDGAARTFEFKDDLQVIPIRGPGQDPKSTMYTQFVLKTKNFENEQVENALIAKFGERLRARSLIADQPTEAMKLVQFEFTESVKQEADELQTYLRDSLNDSGAIVVPGEDGKWTVFVSQGKALKALQAELSVTLKDRLIPENIRWKPDSLQEVVVSLVKAVEIEKFVEELQESFPGRYDGVTGKTADETVISETWAQKVALTFPKPVESSRQFQVDLKELGLIDEYPIREGQIVDRMPHVKMLITARSADEIRTLIEPEKFVLLDAEEKHPGQFLIDAGIANYEGDTDDLEGLLAGLLKDRVSNPVIANTTIRGNVAREMSVDALYALLFSLVAIILYVSFRFEFRFGVASIVALVHDVSISLAVLALAGIEFDLTIVGALLTVVGYSLNDTIVIFDRIRENLRIWAAKPIKEVINISINQTISRTMLTSITTLLVVVVLRVLGGDDLAPFSTALICGVLVGTYSSIFVASPLLVMFGGSLRSTLRPVEEPKEESGEPAPQPNV